MKRCSTSGCASEGTSQRPVTLTSFAGRFQRTRDWAPALALTLFQGWVIWSWIRDYLFLCHEFTKLLFGVERCRGTSPAGPFGKHKLTIESGKRNDPGLFLNLLFKQSQNGAGLLRINTDPGSVDSGTSSWSLCTAWSLSLFTRNSRF